MSFEDVLVHVSAAETPALAAAIRLARRHDARLIGLGVKGCADLGMYGIEPIPPSIAEAFEEAAAAELEAAKSRFDKAVEQHGYPGRSEWRCERGILVESIGFNGALYRRDRRRPDQSQPRSPPFGLLAELALGSGRPVMIIGRRAGLCPGPCLWRRL
ncbi:MULTISPECIES: hypothetical protein [unclassified Inquilinus]|uniref:hypothetical protein n=1 Tax=unclassified Inquilinus TaxID=2645927 RepID=UPI003F9010B2